LRYRVCHLLVMRPFNRIVMNQVLPLDSSLPQY
jgi:hypothetical protein